MFAARMIYIAILVTAICLYALYPFWISWYLLVLVLLLIPFDLIVSIPGMVTKRINLTAPRVLERGEHGRLVISMQQRRQYPTGYIKAKLKEINDDKVKKMRIVCSPERDSTNYVNIDSSRCGAVFFEIKHIRNTSLLGLFSLSHRINYAVAVIILPEPIKPINTVSLPRELALRPKLDGSFSEDHELRLYRPGDPAKSIHWKLSAKIDSIVIREPLETPPHSRLVQMTQWSGIEERNLIIGRFRWVSDYLLKRDLPFYVKFGDNGTMTEVSKWEEFIDCLCRIIGVAAPYSKTPSNMPNQFTWVLRIDGKLEEDH